MTYGMADPISKPAWRYTIGSTPEFWLISSSQNDPLLGPQFHPPRVVNWRPHISMPMRSPDLIPSCTLRYKSYVCLLSCESLALPWPGEPRVRMMPILVILAS